MKDLTIHYEGWWQCRQATDPDPSRDPRGVSGFVFATGWENDLDQIVRMQRDEIEDCDFRVVPDDPSCEQFGVFVTGVTLDDEPWAPGQLLVGGAVRLLPYGKADAGPRMEMRNTITYQPRRAGIYMPIVPFRIRIASTDEGVILSRDDPLDPNHPSLAIWEIGDAEVYRRRCPTRFVYRSDEVLDAIGVPVNADPDEAFNLHFRMREEWIQVAIAELIGRHRRGEIEDGDFRVRRAALEMRLFALRFTDAFEDRLGLMCEWDHALVGPNVEVPDAEVLGGEIRRSVPWHVRFWMGGFDGDLMRGYMRGTLTLPFEPTSS